jgi:long-subunit fatty acid transport protein
MRFKNIKLAVVVLLLIAVSGTVYAGPRTKIGTAAAPELLIPIGSVGTSLSGSNMSYITGVESMYWNPAGISQISSTNTEVMFSHMNYIADMNMQTLGAVAKVGNLGVIGASIRTLNIGEIMETSELQPEGTGNVFNPTYLVAGITFARQMTDKIRFGTTVNLINEDIADVSATGFAFDFGIQYIGGNSGFTFGIALKNLGPSMSFTGPGLDRSFIENGQATTRRVTLQDFDLPTNLELGVAYKLDLNKQNQIMLSSAFQNSGFSSDEYRFGLEYNFNNNFYLRGSYNYLSNKEEGEGLFGPSFGAGLRYPFGNLMVAFDYAYRIVEEENFNSTNQFFTLKVGF